MNYQRKYLWVGFGIIFIVVVILVGLTLVNFRLVNSFSSGTEFIQNWKGFQMLLKESSNPYSDRSAQIIQDFTSSPITLGSAPPLRFTAPLYSVVFYLPFSLISNRVIAQALWMTLLEVAIIALATLSIRVSGWKPDLISLVVFIFFSIFWFHSFSSIMIGSSAILSSFFITAALFALDKNSDELAGVLLAFATIKLQLAGLVIIFILYWGFRNGRGRIMGWFFATLGLLSLSSVLIMPDWILYYFRSAVSTYKSGGLDTIQEAISFYLPGIGSRAGLAMSYVLALLLLIEWSAGSRSQGRSFLWAVYLTFLIGQCIGLPTDTSNFVFFIPPLALVFSVWHDRFGKMSLVYSLGTMILLFTSLWVLIYIAGSPGQFLSIIPAMFISMPVFMFVLLYWVRWWVFHPHKVWFDDISFLEKQRKF